MTRMRMLTAAAAMAAAGAAVAAHHTLDFTMGASAIAAQSPAVRAATCAFAASGIPEIAEGDTLEIKFFDDAEKSLEIGGETPGAGCALAFAAHLGDGVFGSMAVLRGDGASFEARDFAANRLYRAEIGGGKAFVEEVDLAAARHGECREVDADEPHDAPAGRKTLLGAVAGNPFDDNIVAPAPVTVDIMLVFDDGAREWLEKSAKYSSMTNFAMAQVTKMNLALRNTGLHTNFWFRLVDVAAVDGRWTKIDETILQEIRTGIMSRSGVWSGIAERREKCGADLVSLIIDTGSSYGITGIGYITHGTDYTTWVNTYRTWCYSCCAIRSVENDYTLCHEVGHNLGLSHSPTLPTWSKPGTFDYSNGYNITNANDGRHYNTIMAYNYDKYYNDYIEIPYFSSPDYTYRGAALGTALSNDCTRALRQTCRGIADWHATAIALPSDVIFSPSGSSAYRIALSTPGGYEIRYTTDGSEPARDSPLYTGPIYLTSGTATIKAVAVIDESTTGAVASKTYTAAVEMPEFARLATPAEKWTSGDWRDQDGAKVDNATWYLPSGITAILEQNADIEVNTSLNIGSLVIANSAPYRIDTAGRSLNATNIEVVGAATLCGTTWSFKNWRLHPDSTIIVNPGRGQSVAIANNLSLSSPTATFAVTNGTVVAAASGSAAGQFGAAALHIQSGGTLKIAGGGWNTGSTTASPLTIDRGGTLEIAAVDDLHRALTLDGGTIKISKTGRAASFYDLLASVTDDSTITDNGGGGQVWIRTANATIDVADGKTLTFDAPLTKPSDNGYQTPGKGIVKTGQGRIRFLREISHLGTNFINQGTISVGYSSALAAGAAPGWIVADGATLEIEHGCSLRAQFVSLAPGSSLALPAAGSAPLEVSSRVDLADVAISLGGAQDVARGATYPLLASSGGIVGFARADTSGLPELGDGLAWKLSVNGGTLFAQVTTAENAAKPFVDVLVGFDEGARQYVAAKNMTLESFAEARIADLNAILATNRLDRAFAFRLAGTCTVAARYNTIEEVKGLLVDGVGPCVTLRAWRELCGADTVTLLTDTSGATLGYGCPLSSPTDVASCHEDAFSVCSISAVHAGAQHTMMHEIAHNMGCGHARAQAQANSPFAYGRGFYFHDANGVKRHTIMAYDVDGSGVYAHPSPYFSTPSGEFALALGDSDNDNSRVLQETCGTVSGWRETAAVELDPPGENALCASWRTSGRFPWHIDKDGCLRSPNHTDYSAANKKATMPLTATVEGPRTLSFKHKSYFMGSDRDTNHSHFDVLLDDVPVLSQTECTNNWTESSIFIPKGIHRVMFVYSQRCAMNNPGDYKDFLENPPEGNDAVWLKDISFGEMLPTVLRIGEGESVNLGDVGETIDSIVGTGELVCDGSFPAAKYGFTNDTWHGTVALKNLSGDQTKNTTFMLYGNAASKISLENCKLLYLDNINSAFPGTLELAGAGTAFSTSDGYSGKYNVFGALEGTGSMSFTGAPTQGYVFEAATNFTGSISVEGRRVVFGSVASASDLPANGGTITIKAGATASIGAAANWYAKNGIEIAGVLLVKGPDARLDCDGKSDLVLKDGASLKFDSADASIVFGNKPKFDSGTVKIEFNENVKPPKSGRIVTWPSKPGGNFTSGIVGRKLIIDDLGISIAQERPPDEYRMDIPGSDAYITLDSSLKSWMHSRGYPPEPDEFPEMVFDSWQDFMLGKTAANGYSYWQCYALGLDKTWLSTNTLNAKIQVKDGIATITTAENARDLDGVELWTTLYGSPSLVSPLPFIMNVKGTSIQIPAGNTGFYQTEISFQQE